VGEINFFSVNLEKGDHKAIFIFLLVQEMAVEIPPFDNVAVGQFVLGKSNLPHFLSNDYFCL